LRPLFICVASSLYILVGVFFTSIKSADFSYKAGLGYDFISQEYFLDSIAESGEDSVDFALKTEYIDDLKGQFFVTCVPFKDNRMYLNASYEQSPDFIRMRLMNDYRVKLKSSRLDFYGELDWKNPYGDSSENDDGYIYGYLKSNLSVPLNHSVNFIFQLKTETVDFDSVSSYNYDYYRVGGKIGISKYFENFSFGDINLFLINRKVSDSTQLDYYNYGLEGNYWGFWGPAELNISALLERKNYNQQNNEDDFYRFELNTDNKLRIGSRYFSRQEIDLDLTFYGQDDPVNQNYGRFGFALLTGYENDQLSFGIGPEFEYLYEIEKEITEGEDYFEGGLRFDFDMMKIDYLFASVESVLGYRDLKYENDLQSNFTYERLSIIGDLRIWGGLSANLLFSAEWEWHKKEGENSEIYLLSSNLNYSF